MVAFASQAAGECMFKDGITGKNSLPKQKAHKIVTKTRNKQYFDKEGKLIGEGTEIVEEKLVLPETVELLRNGEIQITQADKTLSRRNKTIERRDKTTKEG